MGIVLTPANIALGRVTKPIGHGGSVSRSIADFRGQSGIRRVPGTLSGVPRPAVPHRIPIVPHAASKTTLETVTYAFDDNGTAVMDAPVANSPEVSMTSSRESEVSEGDVLATSGMTTASTPRTSTPLPDLERLTFEPSRVVTSEAAAAAQAATAGPAQGQTDESAMAAFTSDDMLCMLYGVDQDKEDSKYKVAFFDLDAVVAEGALRNAAGAVRDAVGGGEVTQSGSATLETQKSVPNWLKVLWRPVAALLGFLAATFANTSASSQLDGSNKTSLTSADSFETFQGLEADENSTDALAKKIYQSHLAFGVFPEAVRFAKQLRYDGYKVVVVTSAANFMAKPVAEQLGASKVIGTELEVDNGEFTGRVAIDEAESTKSSKVKKFAKDVGVSLSRSLAYGRFGATSLDLMETVGKAYAVSPDARLAELAAEKGWQTLGWAEDAARRTVEAAGVETVNIAQPQSSELAFAGASLTVPKNAASKSWTMRDPDQYDPENERRGV